MASLPMNSGRVLASTSIDRPKRQRDTRLGGSSSPINQYGRANPARTDQRPRWFEPAVALARVDVRVHDPFELAVRIDELVPGHLANRPPGSNRRRGAGSRFAE